MKYGYLVIPCGGCGNYNNMCKLLSPQWFLDANFMYRFHLHTLRPVSKLIQYSCSIT